MAKAGTVYIDVRADTTGFLADLQRASTKAQGSFGGFSKSATLVAGVGIAAGVATTGLVKMAGAAVSASTDFNKALSGVGAVANATAADLGLLSDAALAAGADTVFSATEAANAEAELARAGIAVSDILGGALTGSLDLAAAGQLDLGTAATITAQSLNVFGLNGDQASRVADVLAAGASKSATDVEQLGQALAQGGLVADQFGIGLEDTVGVLARFADNTLIGSDAGTSLKVMLQRLVPQSAEAKKVMDDLGLSFFDQAGNFIGIAETAEELKVALSGLTEEQRLSALTTLFGSDGIRAAGELFKAGADGVREYTDAVNDQGAAQRIAATQLDNLSGDLEALRGSTETVLIGLGSSFDSGLREIVQGATGLVNDLGDALDSSAFEAIADNVSDLLGSAASDLLGFGGDLVAVFDELEASDVDQFFTNLRESVDGLEGPLLGVGGALASLAGSKLTMGLLPGLSPLTAALGGIVLQSEEGREALGSMFEVAQDAAEVFAPVIGVAADALGFLADEGWLVRAALDAFIAAKIVGAITPMIGAVKGLAGGFTFLKGEIANVAATKGVSQLEALKGVIGSSTGTITSFGTAALGVLGPAGIIAGGLYLYQDWTSRQRETEQATKDLTDALLAQGNVNVGAELASKLTDMLDADEDIGNAFSKTGLAISDITNAINEGGGELGRFSEGLIASGGVTEDFEQLAGRALGTLSGSTRGLVEELFALKEAGEISRNELVALLELFGDLDQGGSAAAVLIQSRAERFKEEAEGANLSAAAQRNLATALDDNANLQTRRDALDDLAKAYPELAQAAGIAADAIEDTDKAAADAGGTLFSLAGASEYVAGAFDKGAQSLFGFAGAAEEAGGSFLDLLDAQDSADDAADRIADAQKNLQDILTGNTEGVNSAREALAEANKALATARSETGPGSQAARSAAGELRDARQALQDALTEQGKTPTAGDFYEDQRDEVLDALDRVAEAQQKLAEINSGTSDQVVTATERVAEAEGKLGEELAKTGPASQEAKDAQEALSDAQRDGARTSEAFGDALAAVSTEDVPAAIAALQELQEQYGLNKEEIDKIIGALLIKAALEQAPPPTPTTPTVPGYTGTPQHIDGFPTGTSRSGVAQRERVPSYQSGPGRARGGDVWEDTLHPVNELGPEMFTDRSGSQYLMPGAGGGTVTPMGNGDLIGEFRAMRADLLISIRDVVRAMAPAGATEALSPILREIERNTRTGIAGTSGGAMASMRSAQAEFAR